MDNRDDYDPIIATRRSREPPREDTRSRWPLVLALAGALAVAALLGWWWMGRSLSHGASPSAQSEGSASELRAKQTPAPLARDSEPSADVANAPASPARAAETAASVEQAATPENVPAVVPDNAVQAPVPPTPVSVRFMSPDLQVRIELRGLHDSSPAVMSKPGDLIAVAPGTYRVTVSGPQLETFELDTTFDGERPLKYTVELCAERKHERENLAGQVVEEQTCARTAQCESMFAVLSERAEQLVKDRAFRTQQCAKWRPRATPEGKWTLDTNCGGATLATTCSIEISQGACTFTEPRRSARGTACPRVELK
jgi:hypothetical protein